ncbi:NusG domain II-containing protein [Anaerorhabdus sp.]|uniref:NusG domain II-containing protein n=1 Tax=Anaerorhabdus sp. TaxID=1872524 RepID=UPI002FCCAE11
MRKNEIIVIFSIFIAAISIYGIVYLADYNRKQSEVIKVLHKTENILELDSRIDGEYSLEGSFGKFTIEINNHQWRITNEECPNHTCSSLGWISKINYYPIICLPNEISIELKIN